MDNVTKKTSCSVRDHHGGQNALTNEMRGELQRARTAADDSMNSLKIEKKKQVRVCVCVFGEHFHSR